MAGAAPAKKSGKGEPSADTDTVLCFVAFGGQLDRSGEVEADLLKQTCRRFGLATEIERLIGERCTPALPGNASGEFSPQDSDAGGRLNYRDFEDIFDSQGGGGAKRRPSVPGDDDLLAAAPKAPQPPLRLGIDYQQLVEKEQQERGVQPALSGLHPADGARAAGIPKRRSQHGGWYVSRNRAQADLRAKGVPPALYGGAEPEEGDAAETLSRASPRGGGSARRRRMQPPPEVRQQRRTGTVILRSCCVQFIDSSSSGAAPPSSPRSPPGTRRTAR
eukprot:TRINITY_DN10777_c0_g1_i1.p1 TRINITY_DN10777_c0_g1~~TRINITY_DN10777_c0_g1_i1.p1  ORF type:complete len:276 (+),score=89.35 TRINITY_DN10777_c0_g1_i1:78-905(+)